MGLEIYTQPSLFNNSITTNLLSAVSSFNNVITVTESLCSVGHTNVIDVSTNNPALRVTQRGVGNVLEIEDRENPDFSPFVVAQDGTVVIGYSGVPFFSEASQGVQIVSESPESSLRSENKNNIQLVRAGDIQGNLRFLRVRGTLTDPLSVEPNDRLGGILFTTWNAVTGANGRNTYFSSAIYGNVDTQPTSGVAPGNLTFETTSQGGSGLEERMRIDSEGRVGIGTTTPNERLTVNGNISATGDIYVENYKGLPAEIGLACSDEVSDLFIGTDKISFRIPYAFILTQVRGSLNIAASGQELIADINKNGSSILSTKMSFVTGEKTTLTSPNQPVISTTLLENDSEISVDIDQVGSTSPGVGLKVWLIGYKS